MTGEAASGVQLARDIAVNAVQIGVIALWLARVSRWNVAAVIVAVAVPGLMRAALGLASQPNAFYLGNAIALFAVAALIAAAPCVAWRGWPRAVVTASITAPLRPGS